MSAEDRKYTVGAVTFNNMFQVGMGAPIDNRIVVRRKAHLVSGIGENKYYGLTVYVTGEYDSELDDDSPAPQTDENGIVESEVGFYYYKGDVDGENKAASWVKMLTIADGGSGGSGGTTIPIDVLPVDEPNGVAPLDENGLVPSGNLPSYVDDVIEGYGRMEGTDPNKYIVFYKKQVIDGYLYNGAFYSDSAHTTEITPSAEKYYYDKTGSALYYYDFENIEYVAFYQYEVIDGYYYNGAFYSDAEHTTEITPAANKYYRSLANSLVYYYDTENAEYKLVADEDAPFIVGGKSKIYVDLLTDKTYRWGGSVYTEISNTQVSKSFTTNIAVGGIATGTTIDSSMSLEDVLKKILVNVYQPRVTKDASASISSQGSATVIEIGKKDNLSYNYTVTGERGTVKLNNGTSDTTLGKYAGAITKFRLYQSGNTDTVVKEIDLATKITDQTGTQTINISVNSTTGNFQITYKTIVVQGYYYNGEFYSDSAHTTVINPSEGSCYMDLTGNVGKIYEYNGSTYSEMSSNSHTNITNLTTATEQIITFKGGVTFENGTKYPDSAGGESTLAAFTGQEKKSSGTTIEVVCPVYANTNSAALSTTVSQGAKSKSVLSSTTDFSSKTPEQSANIGLNISFPSHSSANPYTFEIPNSWTLRSVWWWDTGFNVWRCHYNGTTVNDWALKAYTNGNSETVYYHDKEVNGVHVNYKTYYYTSPDNIGNRIYKVLISQ